MNNNLLDRVRSLNKDIIIREANSNNKNDFIHLLNKQYERKRTIEYFDWMFVNNYLKTKLFAAYDKNEMIGFYGVRFHTLSNDATCGFAVDLLIKENYRNRGIFILLENEVYKTALLNNAVALTALPNNNGMKAHTGIDLWKNISKIDSFVLDCNKNIKLGNGIQSKIEADNIIYFFKNDRYRQWRYDMNPVYKYSKVKISEGIFSITKIFEDKLNNVVFGDIVDFECDMNDISLIQKLFYKSCEHLIEQKVEFITAWAVIPLLQECLESLGFYPESRERYFCVKVINNNYQYLYDINNWHLVQADSEIY